MTPTGIEPATSERYVNSTISISFIVPVYEFMYVYIYIYIYIYIKVKCILVQALRLCTGRTAHTGSRGIALPFLDHDTRGGRGVSITPRPLFTPGKDPVPIVQKLGGPQGRSGQVRKISPPPGFDPRTVQSVANRYTDYATRPIYIYIYIYIYIKYIYICLRQIISELFYVSPKKH